MACSVLNVYQLSGHLGLMKYELIPRYYTFTLHGGLDPRPVDKRKKYRETG